MTYRIGLLIISTFFFSSPLYAQSLSIEERHIVQAIQKQQPEQLLLLEKLVNINSGTENLEGVYAVGKQLEAEFQSLGFTTRWEEEPPALHRAGTLIATHPGARGKRILLLGHLDTVFPQESAFQHFQRHHDLATGPGVVDDKGGDVVLLYALKGLKAAHALEEADITVALMGDEENSGKPTSLSRKSLRAAAQNKDAALGFELANTLDTATIARRGIAQWTLKTEGIEAHSSEILTPSVGAGAVFELSRILQGMYSILVKNPSVSINASVIWGGTLFKNDKKDFSGWSSGASNVVPKIAIAKGDLRFLTLKEKAVTEKYLQTITQQHLAHTTASLFFKEGIPSMPPTFQNKALLRQYSDISIALGYGAVHEQDPLLRGAADISYVASRIPANLDGLGPLGTNTHSARETVNIPSLTTQTEKAALLIYRLIKQPREK